jgi:hypothetical protein
VTLFVTFSEFHAPFTHGSFTLGSPDGTFLDHSPRDGLKIALNRLEAAGLQIGLQLFDGGFHGDSVFLA